MYLFGRSTKSPRKVVQKLSVAISVLAKDDEYSLKAQQAVSKNLARVKGIIYGTYDAGQSTTMAVSELSHELHITNMLLLLIQNLSRIDFEAKKDVVQIFNNLLIRRLGARSPTVDHICTNPTILYALMAGYANQSITFHIGSMLRECITYEQLAKTILYSEEFFNLFRYIDSASFDIASDAFSTFKKLLTRHKILCAEFLEQNYDRVFNHYEQLLNSENYVTRRQSLELLGQLLHDTHNKEIMLRYISKEQNLKLMMKMMNDQSGHNRFEAFHIFKCFVGNPDKPSRVEKILLRNQQKLVTFLSRFLPNNDNEWFIAEKEYVIKLINELERTTDE